MDPLDTAYMVAGLPLAGLALHCWGRSAKKRSARWFLLGVALGAVGFDGLRLLLRAVGEQPAEWPYWVVVGMLGVSLTVTFSRTWRRLDR
jgi:hypothetical protein